MAGKEKVIAVVGVSEEDTAHLRLMLRKASEHLKFQWRWGVEDGADLVVIDPSTFSGKLARNRFGAIGARCALLLDADAKDDADLQLRRPLKLNQFLAVLRQVEGNVVEGLELVPITDDFYFRDDAGLQPEHSLDELSAFESDYDESAAGEKPLIRNSGEADYGLDEMLQQETDTAAHKPRFAVPVQLKSDTAIEATEPSARSEQRSAEQVSQLRPGGMRIDPDAAPPFKRAAAEDPGQAQPLSAYLASNLLGGPARLRLESAPPLVLDPKLQAFHSPGGLAALEPYFRANFQRSAWEALTSAEIAALRDSEPARPYELLRWLDARLQSGGRLAGHLDPGGTYRLVRDIDLGADYAAARRVAAVLALPHRLHEIATAAATDMAEVFDTVNAYESIGCIEWTPRAPRHVDAAAEGKRGLLGKLKLPFGKK